MTSVHAATVGQVVVALVGAAVHVAPSFPREVAALREGPPPAVIWRQGAEGRGRPAHDRATAYFLSKRHEVVAIAADTGVERWRTRTGEPGETTDGSALVIAGPVVVAGDYNLVGIDRATGSVRWRFVPLLGYGPGIYLGMAHDAVVLAGSPAGRLYALSAWTGDLHWTAVVASDATTTVFPPATDGRIVAAGYTTFEAPSTGGVALLDFDTGHEVWRTSFPRAADPRVGTGSAGGPVLTPSLVIASSGDGTIYAFCRTDGSLRWLIPPLNVPPPFGSPIPHAPVLAAADYRPLAVSGSLLIAGSLSGQVVAYDLATRREQWRYANPRSGSVSFGIASDDRVAYVPFVSGRHLALDARTGAERWRTASSDEGFNWLADPAGDRVFLAGTKGGFVAVHR